MADGVTFTLWGYWGRPDQIYPHSYPQLNGPPHAGRSVGFPRADRCAALRH